MHKPTTMTCIINCCKHDSTNSYLFGSDILSLSWMEILRKHRQSQIWAVFETRCLGIMWKNVSAVCFTVRYIWLKCLYHTFTVYLQYLIPHTQSKHLGNSLKLCIACWLAYEESEQVYCWIMALGGNMVTGAGLSIIWKWMVVRACIMTAVCIPSGIEVSWRASSSAHALIDDMLKWLIFINELQGKMRYIIAARLHTSQGHWEPGAIPCQAPSLGIGR